MTTPVIVFFEVVNFTNWKVFLSWIQVWKLSERTDLTPGLELISILGKKNQLGNHNQFNRTINNDG